MAERMIEVNGVELRTESFGAPSDPAVLLVMGVGAAMLWWEEGIRVPSRPLIRTSKRRTACKSTAYRPPP